VFALNRHKGTVLSTARLAQSVEHQTLNLGVTGSSPVLGFLTKCENFFFEFYLFTLSLNCIDEA
jgi:hypothetical protein